MRHNRIFAWISAAALAVSLAVTPAAAYTDVVGQWSWAAPDIEAMTQRGLLRGYNEDTFGPANALLASQALTVAARLRVPDEELRNQIGADRQEEVETLIPAAQSWLWNDAATCLEAGIVSHEELEAICGEGRLQKPMPLEEFSVYIARAIGLEPTAKRVKNAPLSYSDADQVSEAARPYVYLLSVHAILRGNTDGELTPRVPVNRARTAAILARAIKYMELNRVSQELAEYTDYDWAAGIISQVAAGEGDSLLLTLGNDRDETVTLTCPLDIKVYQNNMELEDGLSVLRQGIYARVAMDEAGVPAAIRLSGSLETVSGGIVELNGGKSLRVSVDGVEREFAIDRFTQVRIGETLGDRDIIDPAAGYTTAVCGVDELGSLVRLELVGGTHEAGGVLAGVSGSTAEGYSLVVRDLYGKPTRYAVAPSAEITVNGIAGSAIAESYVGVCYASLRVSDRTGEVQSVEIDTKTRYGQGVIVGVDTAGDPWSITLRETEGEAVTTYPVAKDVASAYGGLWWDFSRMAKDWYATVELVDGVVTRMDSYPAYTFTEGTVAAPAQFGDDMVTLEVLLPSGERERFELDLDRLPSIKRDGAKSSVEKLKQGDSVKVTAQYYRVIRVEAAAQRVTVDGIVQQKVETLEGITLALLPDDSETAETYLISESVPVTQEGKKADLSSVKAGSRVSITMDGGEIYSIEVKSEAVAATEELRGKVLYINITERTILLLLSDNEQITVEVPEKPTILDVTTTKTLTLEELKRADTLQIHGSYAGQTFKVTTILRK